MGNFAERQKSEMISTLNLEEKRRPLDLWAVQLRNIVEPPPNNDNVVPLQREA